MLRGCHVSRAAGGARGPTLATLLRPKGGKTRALLCSHHVLLGWPVLQRLCCLAASCRQPFLCIVLCGGAPPALQHPNRSLRMWMTWKARCGVVEACRRCIQLHACFLEILHSKQKENEPPFSSVVPLQRRLRQ